MNGDQADEALAGHVGQGQTRGQWLQSTANIQVPGGIPLGGGPVVRDYVLFFQSGTVIFPVFDCACCIFSVFIQTLI